MKLRMAVVAVIGLMALVGPIASAQAQLVGRWPGYGRSEVSNRLVSPCLDVLSQARGRFRATVEITPCFFEADGSVMPNGILSGRGRDAATGDTIVFAGRARSVGVIDPNQAPIRLMSLLYGIFDARGSLMDWGFTLHMQMQGGPHWQNPGPVQDPSGHWMGDFKSRTGPGGGCMTMDLAQQRNDRTEGLTTAFGGTANLMNVYVPAVQSFFDVFLDLKGTVGLPAVQRDGSMVSSFGAISVETKPGPIQSPGIIAILIGLLIDPPQTGDIDPCFIPGQYRLYDSFFDVFLDVVFDGGTAFDQGVFGVERQPGPIN